MKRRRWTFTHAEGWQSINGWRGLTVQVITEMQGEIQTSYRDSYHCLPTHTLMVSQNLSQIYLTVKYNSVAIGYQCLRLLQDLISLQTQQSLIRFERRTPNLQTGHAGTCRFLGMANNHRLLRSQTFCYLPLIRVKCALICY